MVLLKSQSVTSISSKSVAHNEDVLHHIALVNVDGIFHHLADTFFKLLADENILEIIDDQFVAVKSHQSSTTPVKLVQLLNIYCILVTLLVFQPLRFK